jgi:hypothetical protein
MALAFKHLRFISLVYIAHPALQLDYNYFRPYRQTYSFALSTLIMMSNSLKPSGRHAQNGRASTMSRKKREKNLDKLPATARMAARRAHMVDQSDQASTDNEPEVHNNENERQEDHLSMIGPCSTLPQIAQETVMSPTYTHPITTNTPTATSHPANIDPSTGKHIPRPPNMFMLFRAAFYGKVKADLERVLDRKVRQIDISKALSRLWEETDKRPWKEKAFQEAERHAKMYPSYRYTPRRKPKVQTIGGQPVDNIFSQVRNKVTADQSLGRNYDSESHSASMASIPHVSEVLLVDRDLQNYPRPAELSMPFTYARLLQEGWLPPPSAFLYPTNSLNVPVNPSFRNPFQYKPHLPSELMKSHNNSNLMFKQDSIPYFMEADTNFHSGLSPAVGDSFQLDIRLGNTDLNTQSLDYMAMSNDMKNMVCRDVLSHILCCSSAMVPDRLFLTNRPPRYSNSEAISRTTLTTLHLQCYHMHRYHFWINAHFIARFFSGFAMPMLLNTIHIINVCV